jgi:uncharacterized membrane protein
MAKRKTPAKTAPAKTAPARRDSSLHVPPLPIRIYRLHAKLALAALVGVAVAAAMLALNLPNVMRLLIGWNVGIVVYLVLTYAMMRRASVATIRKRASSQDEGARAILLLSIVATFAGLGAVVFALGGAKQAGAAPAIVLAVCTILLSWAFVHTIFSFHYAHEYYGEGRDGKIGGLEFPGDTQPDYRDFLYFSLVIGMTSQVSDVPITSKVIRRIAALHGVLSFFFNLVVLALTVNMVANLI